MNVFVYIDGFNLYYSIAKLHPQCKWLDLMTLAQAVLGTKYSVGKVRYFTAHVSGKINSGAKTRQDVYLRALGTLGDLEIHYGRFQYKTKWRRVFNTNASLPAWRPPSAQIPAGMTRREPLGNPIPGQPVSIEVYHTEEKGSDVNLATHLLNDAWHSRFDAAAVLSNDTDLIEPIRLVASERKKPVILMAAQSRPAQSLVNVATNVRRIRHAHFRNSLFPNQIPGTNITKPPSW